MLPPPPPPPLDAGQELRGSLGWSGPMASACSQACEEFSSAPQAQQSTGAALGVTEHE